MGDVAHRCVIPLTLLGFLGGLDNPTPLRHSGG